MERNLQVIYASRLVSSRLTLSFSSSPHSHSQHSVCCSRRAPAAAFATAVIHVTATSIRGAREISMRRRSIQFDSTRLGAVRERTRLLRHSISTPYIRTLALYDTQTPTSTTQRHRPAANVHAQRAAAHECSRIATAPRVHAVQLTSIRGLHSSVHRCAGPMTSKRKQSQPKQRADAPHPTAASTPTDAPDGKPAESQHTPDSEDGACVLQCSVVLFHTGFSSCASRLCEKSIYSTRTRIMRSISVVIMRRTDNWRLVSEHCSNFRFELTTLD